MTDNSIDRSVLQRGGPVRGGPVLDAPLSSAHIRPRIQFYFGSSFLRSTKDKKLDAVGGGKRSKIKGFSKQSRKRLMDKIACVRRDAELPDFVTLTYPAEFPTVERAKRDIKVFLQRLIRAFPEIGGINKLEPQERGAPHYHMLVWGVKTHVLLPWVVQNWYEIAGNGDENHKKFHAGELKDSKPCVEKVRSFRGVWSYASKYLGKTFEVAQWGSQWTGRFWGVFQPQNIPFGELVEVSVSSSRVVEFMRYQRRFMKMRGKNLNSLKTYCDANQWIERLIPCKKE